MSDPQGRPLEVLRVRAELQAHAAFEPALRERAAALSSFADPAFARVHRVGPLSGPTPALGVLSDRPEGRRLSSLLAQAAAGELDTTPRVAVAVLRQLVPAADALCRHAPGLAHGALAPERVIVEPDGRLRVADAVFGSALERLNLSRRELWRGFRIAIPPAAGPARIDARVDITALGIIALALLLTRPVGEDEYPSRVAVLAREVVDLWVLRGRPAPPAVAEWVATALQVDPRHSFATMADALAALMRTPAWQIDEASARCVLAAWAAGETVARQARRSQRIRLAAADGVTAPPPAAADVPRAQSAPEPTPAPPPAAAAPVAPLRPAEPRAPARRPTLRVVAPAPPPARWRRRWLLWSVAALAGLGSLAIVFWGWHQPAAVDTQTGTLVIDSVPAGVQLFVDGDRRGATPARLVLEAGLHTVELRSRAGRKTLPVRITAGEQQVQHVKLRAAPRPVPPADASKAAPGWLDVDAPFDLDLREGDTSLGILKNGRLPLPPGRHEIQLVNDELGFRQTCRVQIAAGHATTLPLDVPFGRVHVNASPWAQVWIDGTQVGDTPLGDLSVPIGPHEFRFQNPQFGQRRYAVTVTLTEPLYLTVDMRAE